MLGIFTIGLFMPWLDSRNTLIGAVTGLTVSIWITLRAQFDLAAGLLKFPTMPVSVEGCTYTFNSTLQSAASSFVEPDDADPSRPFHHISYLYYTVIGAGLTIAVASISGFILGMQDPKNVNPVLLTPLVRKYFAGTEQSKLANLPLTPSDVSCTTYNFEKEKLASVNKDENEEKMKQ